MAATLTAINSAITALDNAAIDRTTALSTDAGTLYTTLKGAGLQNEAEQIRNMWSRLRAVLDQAKQTATTAGL